MVGDVRERLRELPERCVHTVVTSPPYFGLRDYGSENQIGLEETPEQYVAELVLVFEEVKRVLRDDGTVWLNVGDSYATQPGKGANVPQTKHPKNTYPTEAPHRSQSFDGIPPKNLLGIPWRLAFGLQAAGWYLRQDIIWHKPNVMPESVKDRCTKAHEYVFLLSKRPNYYFDHEAIKEPAVGGQSGMATMFKRPAGNKRAQTIPNQSAGTHRPDRDPVEYNGELRNRRSVWSINTKPFKGAHFAVFPEALVEPCVLAGAPCGGMVLDPFAGSGTTGVVANRLGRDATLVEVNPTYAEMARDRIAEAGYDVELG